MSKLARAALALLAFGVAASGCNSACFQSLLEYCSQCEGDLEGWGALQCVCAQTGTLSKSDAEDEDVDFDTDEEAEQWCDAVTYGLQNVDDDIEAACRAGLKWMRAWPGESCPDAGDDDDDNDSSR